MSEHKLIQFKSGTYRLMPELPSNPCDGCAFVDLDCSDSPCDEDREILIEDTPEALARYIALRMTT